MNPKILFIGGTIRGLSLLKMLIDSGEKIVFAYIMKEDEHEPIKASGVIRELCQLHNIPSEICRRIVEDKAGCALKLKPNLAFVCGWRTLLRASFTNKIPFGCIAAHDSLLPKYRGFAPLNWAIINGEEETGVTLFKVDNGAADSGDIFRKKVIKINSTETAANVYPRIINATLDLYKEFLIAFKKGKIKYYEQDENRATYACKRIPEDGEICWNKSAVEIFNMIRALSLPYPCAWTKYSDKKILIIKASLPNRQLNYSGNIPGRVVSILSGGVLVLCGEGQIIINSIMEQTGRQIEANEFLSSIQITLGK